MSDYDPFIGGPFTVQARTTEAHDTSRDRVLKGEIWNPSAAGTHPLVVYSHFSVGNRRAACLVGDRICSHGYDVQAVDRCGVFVPVPSLRADMARDGRAG